MNDMRAQLQQMGTTMQAGFARLDRRIDMMHERNGRVANDLFQQNAFIRAQFEELNMRFPPPPPPEG